MFPAITALYAGLLGIILVALSARVVVYRQKFGVSRGDGGHADLARSIRIQGNFTEYVPLALILVMLTELAGYSPLVIHLLGAGMVVARAIHVQGLMSGEGTTAGRVVGASLTFVIILVAAILCLVQGSHAVT